MEKIFSRMLILGVVMTNLTLGGCGTKPIFQSITVPEIGSSATKGVGESLLTQGVGKLEPYKLVIFEDEVTDTFTIRKGEYKFVAENSARIKFIKGGKEIFLYKTENKICIDSEKCSVIKYSVEMGIAATQKKAFQQTLLYSGKIGNKITLGYREFMGDLARAAFSNEVSYDLTESTILGYKGARIEVLKATNTDITYKILSDFN